jgi:cytochrome c biogenesis protein CcmG, thiol:disulfide interchange protein DsbE
VVLPGGELRRRGSGRYILRFLTVRSAFFAVAVAVVGVFGLLVYGLMSKGSNRPKIGDPAPAITLPRLEGGGKGFLSDYRGRWVLVNFWASWCPPCREEAPALERFQNQHGGAAFTILGIDSGDLSDDGKQFIERYEISYPQLHDGHGNAADDYGTTGFPKASWSILMGASG